MTAVATPIGADRPDATNAEIREVDGRTVVRFEVDGRRHGTSGAADAEVVERALALAEQLGCPVLGIVRSLAVDVDGLDALAAWGRVAVRAVRLSGVVPLLLAVTGPVHGGLATVVALADHLVVTPDTTLYVNGPRAVERVTGLSVGPDELGGAAVHARSGLVDIVADDAPDAEDALLELLAHLPDNYLAEGSTCPTADPSDRPCAVAARIVPDAPTAAYDMRALLADVVDDGDLLELQRDHAANVITAYGRLGGRSVAIVANQPAVRAGTLDIAASVKAARHIRRADALGLPLVTFVDTPGYEPGRDLEWRGMIRHGAKLVHAYADATVPRVCVVVRKAYGGAYIVMDSRTMGSDLVLAWPGAEIAVMGAAGAVEILHRRELATSDDPDRRRADLQQAYEEQFLTPRIAAERGLVDHVVEPAATRAHLVAAVRRLATKRPVLPDRRHANEPL